MTWMIEGTVDASAFLGAKQALERSLAAELNEFTRNSAIQCFEFTLELGWKTVKRVLGLRKITATSPRETIRLAAREGLLEDPEQWLGYFDLRNLTVHTYNLAIAEKVYAELAGFLAACNRLETRLRELG